MSYLIVWDSFIIWTTPPPPLLSHLIGPSRQIANHFPRSHCNVFDKGDFSRQHRGGVANLQVFLRWFSGTSTPTSLSTWRYIANQMDTFTVLSIVHHYGQDISLSLLGVDTYALHNIIKTPTRTELGPSLAQRLGNHR